MKAPLAAGALLSGLLLAAAGAAAQGSDSRTSITRPMINGTFIDAANGQGAFSGNITLARFEVRQGSLVAVGTLTGVVADSTGTVLGRVNEEVALPVAAVRATCQRLNLDIGPLELTSVGLDVLVDVHLETDTLDITTREGPTHALLCSTAQLLAANPTPEAVATALNAVRGAMHPPK